MHFFRTKFLLNMTELKKKMSICSSTVNRSKALHIKNLHPNQCRLRPLPPGQRTPTGGPPALPGPPAAGTWRRPCDVCPSAATTTSRRNASSRRRGRGSWLIWPKRTRRRAGRIAAARRRPPRASSRCALIRPSGRDTRSRRGPTCRRSCRS